MNLTKDSIRSYVQFLLVGAGAFIIDAGTYYLLTRKAGLYYIAARVVSLLLTFIWSYTANRYWTFKDQSVQTGRSMLRFAVVNGSAILLNLIGLRLAVDTFGFPDLLSLLVLTLVISVLSYVGHRRWSFQE